MTDSNGFRTHLKTFYQVKPNFKADHRKTYSSNIKQYNNTIKKLIIIMK